MSPTTKVFQQWHFISSKHYPNRHEFKAYYGICQTTFKLRYTNHKKLFNHRKLKSDTELSNEFWKDKNNKRSSKVDTRHITQAERDVHNA